MKFQVKDSNGQINLSIEILSQEHGSEWLEGLIDFDMKGFKSKFKFSLMLGELISFLEDLKKFNSTLKGQAAFANIEDNIKLTFSTDGLGHVLIKGLLRDQTYSVKTSFDIESDQTFLPTLVNEVDQIVKHYLSLIN
jgi:hypothetical protein